MKGNLNLPNKVIIGETSVRDGFQHLEQFIPTDAKVFLLEAIADAGFQHIEAGSFAHPAGLPQFRDVDEVLKKITKKPGLIYTCVTANIRAVERAIKAKKEGWGPERILVMISTSEAHNRANTQRGYAEQWKFIEEAVKIAHDNGILVNGTISTIWGCPIAGDMPIELAYEFCDRLLEIGCDDIEHADHDGQATPPEVYEYFSRTMKRHPDPNLHVFHVHDVRGFGLANYFAAMQAGIIRFETGIGGIGGQPANFLDGVPIKGTGEYYLSTARTGLVSTEDFVTMCDGMGIETGIDLNKVYRIGKWMEKIVGQKLWSFCLEAGKVPRGPREYPARRQ